MFEVGFTEIILILGIALLVLGHRARRRRTSVLFVVSTLLMLVTMTSIAINTASYFSGVAFFLARAELAPEWRLFAVTGLLGGLTTFSTFGTSIGLE